MRIQGLVNAYKCEITEKSHFLFMNGNLNKEEDKTTSSFIDYPLQATSANLKSTNVSRSISFPIPIWLNIYC